MQGLRLLGPNLDGRAVVHRGGGVVADAGVAVLVVVVGEEGPCQKPRASSIDPKRSGAAGQLLAAHLRCRSGPDELLDEQPGPRVRVGRRMRGIAQRLTIAVEH